MIALALAVLLVCPRWGTATAPADRALNELKNRRGTPHRMEEVPLSRLLQAREGSRLPEGVRVEGYVALVRHEGPEACNCHSSTRRDWHIALVERRGDTNPRDRVVVEVTPNYPRIHAGEDLVGKRVVVSGFTLYDFHHAGDSGGRGTAWEVHPITRIELR